MRLSDLVGQDRATAILLRAVASGRLPHALLFDGPDGVGKRRAALGLALALCCPEAPNLGCGTCEMCRRILNDQHPDVRVLVPETSQFLLEQAKDVVALASSRPHEAPARVLIIDQADCLNANAANCLLKTLEEPFPGNFMVLVTAAPARLLPTIRSRSQRVRFSALQPDVLAQLAIRHGTDRAQAETVAAMAGGSAARMFELLEAEQKSNLWELANGFRQAAAASDMGPIFDAAAAFSDKEERQDLAQALALLARFYRDSLALAAGAQDLILLRNHAADMAGPAQVCERRRNLQPLRRAVTAVLDTLTGLASNVNAVTALEKMMMDIRDCGVEAP
ncbi:MAG TPA: DNA polymerase III subunit delta' [Polyangia bacterium]